MSFMISISADDEVSNADYPPFAFRMGFHALFQVLQFRFIASDLR